MSLTGTVTVALSGEPHVDGFVAVRHDPGDQIASALLSGPAADVATHEPAADAGPSAVAGQVERAESLVARHREHPSEPPERDRSCRGEVKADGCGWASRDRPL